VSSQLVTHCLCNCPKFLWQQCQQKEQAAWQTLLQGTAAAAALEKVKRRSLAAAAAAAQAQHPPSLLFAAEGPHPVVQHRKSSKEM
jgi:hypothetical protein